MLLELPRRQALPFLALLGSLLLSGTSVGCGPSTSNDPDGGVDGGVDAGPTEIEVQLLAFNDFHGELRSDTIRTNDEGTFTVGGAATLAAHVAARSADRPNTAVLSGGDLVGASPLLSAVFRDEPTIEAMELLGLTASVIGNHELDEDLPELQRLQDGGCHPVDGCFLAEPFDGASFPFLSANLVAENTGDAIFPAYRIETYQGVQVAFVGITMRNALETTTPVPGVRLEDEVTTINTLVPQLQAQGVEAIVVVMHQSGGTMGLENACYLPAGPAFEIVSLLDPAVDVVILGHSHAAFVCQVGEILVTEAGAKGTFLTDIDLVLDPITGDVSSAVAENVLVTQNVVPDPAVDALIARYEAIATPLAERVVGTITEDLDLILSLAGETPLGAVVADAQLEATADESVVAFQQFGGLRAPLLFTASGSESDGEVTHAEVFDLHPFGNILTTLTLSGLQIHDLLEDQWPVGSAYAISDTLHYTWHQQRTDGDRIDPAEVFIAGVPLDLAADYRVTANNFLTTTTNPRFKVFSEGRDLVTRIVDLEALEAYLQAHSPVAPPSLGRITVAP